MLNPDLIEAYRNTAFVVDSPNGEITLRVGQMSREIDNLLSTCGVTECAFVTAWNPRSVSLDVDQNSQRHADFLWSRYSRAKAQV